MLKNFFCAVLFLFLNANLFNGLYAQDTLTRDTYCAYLSEVDSLKSIIISDPDQRETSILDLIVLYSGITQNFTVKASNVANAEASIKGDNRYITYNKKFIGKVLDQTNSYWASMSILAHELGHHLQNHTFISEANLCFELQADKFSGFILQKMGAEMADVLSAIKTVSQENATMTHPSKNERIIAISNGYLLAKSLEKLKMPNVNHAEKRAFIQDFNTKKTVIGGKSNLSFNACYKKTGTTSNTQIKIVAIVKDNYNDRIYYISDTNEIFDYNQMEKKLLVLMGSVVDTDNTKYEYKYNYQHADFYVNSDAILFAKDENGVYVPAGEVYKF